jgi:hypothetical protein
MQLIAILGEGLFGKQMNHWAGGPAKGIVLTPTSRYRWQVIFHLDDKGLGWDIMFNDRNTGNLESEGICKKRGKPKDHTI